MAGNMKPVEQMRVYLDLIFQIVNEEIIRALSYLGEQCVSKVRDRDGQSSWLDQTGNLRSSVGYAIFEHGVEVVKSAFPVVKNGSQGKEEGERYIKSLANLYTSTYALVVVASMSYAEYVEAHKNKDVLASTELWAMDKIDEYIEKAKQRAENRINKLTR